MFSIDKDQMIKLDEWEDDHDCSIKRDGAGAIGGRLSYCFTPTSMGIITVVKCLCGEDINLTDFEDW